MVHALALSLDDARLVVQQGVGVHTARDRTTVEDLLHHGIGTRNGAVVRNGGVGELAQARAGSTLLREAAAGAGHIQRLAGSVHVLAEALVGVRGAGHIGVRGLVADAGALLGDVEEPLVGPIDAAALAGAHTAAIQQVLHRQVDVHPLSPARDLDTIPQGRDGAVGPAGAAVLRDVLVAGHGAVALAVLVAPCEV